MPALGIEDSSRTLQRMDLRGHGDRHRPRSLPCGTPLTARDLRDSMDHGIHVFDGISKADWLSLQDKLEANQESTAKKLEKVRAAQDFDVNLQSKGKLAADMTKLWQGAFDQAVDGIRSFVRLAEDLLVCTPHLDITKNKQISTGGKLQQRHNPYPERKAGADNPGRYDSPFYLKWVPRKDTGSVIVLTPHGFSDATEHVLETELAPWMGKAAKMTDRHLPKDPFKFLDVLAGLHRLGKIDSATVVLVDAHENVLETATRVFRDEGTLANFKSWVKDRKGGASAVTLKSVNLTLQLNDPGGRGCDMTVRPYDDQIPVGLQVSQKSELRVDAYQVLTEVLKELLF